MNLIIRLIKTFSKKTLSALILVSTILLFVIVYYVSETFHIPLRHFLSDPLSLFHVNPLRGVISNLGVLIWCATASILLFTFFLVIGKVSNKKSSFLLYSAFITAFLLFDDLFMFHEYILLSVGIVEEVMYGIYIVLFGVLFLAFSRILLAAQFKFALIIAFISFGNSIIIDLVVKGEKFRVLFEDGFKFLGIVCWAMFFIFYCLDLTKTTITKE